MSSPEHHERKLSNARRTARAEAAAWIVSLHSAQRSADLEAGFHRWLAESEENAAQFERATEVWEAGTTVPTAGIPQNAQWKKARKTQYWAAAAALALGVGIAGVFAYRHWSAPVYSTGIGEQRLFRLGDGSRISLNSATTIAISFTSKERRISLKKGEAYFEVAKDSIRPFVVTAGDARVTALGTVFTVRYDVNRTAVTLVEGKVSVAAPSSGLELRSILDRPAATESRGATDAVVLSPGERVTFSENNGLKVDEPPLDSAIAWRRGEVVLDKTPLPEAVAEMNRYEKAQLYIDDAATARLNISGIYYAGDSEGFARNVAELYRLEIHRESGRIHLRAR